MIDREQKGILKDLIISGDNELQDALDMYEKGDVTKLQRILESGALSNRAMNDIDLLGDLDLDFLNVSDDHVGNGQLGNASSYSVQPQTSFANNTSDSSRQISGVETASDGIGDLDFDGGIDGNMALAPMESYNRAPSPLYPNIGQRSRSNSTFSVDVDYRQRSNSLFSALIGNVPQEGMHADYGRWMERSSADQMTSQDGRRSKATRRASAPTSFQTVPAASTKTIQNKRSGKTSTGGSKREVRAEEKRRERQEKKERKEREKQEKREKREQAKLEKLKKAEMEEKEEHQPGSGRPRSMSDPNLRTSVDANGLLQVDRPDGWIGAYSPESRKVRIARFLEKRNHRVWTKTVKYDVRKNFADSRLRVKGRFVKKEDELLMRELMSLT